MTERRVQLFITCLAEQFYPSTLRSLVRLLERQDVEVEFPAEQTCWRLGVRDIGARFPRRVAYQASGHLLRGLGLRTEAKDGPDEGSIGGPSG